MSGRRNGLRDTAKDIILGLAPSGQGPREPRGGVARTRNARPSPKPPDVVNPVQPIVISKPDTKAINNLQNQLSQLQKQQNDLLNAEADARRRLEANQDNLARQMSGLDLHETARELEELRRINSLNEAKINSLNQEVLSMKSLIERLSSEISHIGSMSKTRSSAEQNQFDLRIKELQDQLVLQKQLLDAETAARERLAKAQEADIARLHDVIMRNETTKDDLLKSITRKGDEDKEKLGDEARKLNEKVQFISTEVARTMADREAHIREEFLHNLRTLENDVKIQGNTHQQLEKEVQKIADETNRANEGAINNSERLAKLENAFTAAERTYEAEKKKTDNVITADIQARLMHEKGLLAKMNDVEERLTEYVTALGKSAAEVSSGKQAAKLPTFDAEILRREMESIAADKNKMSMEALLKLEEKIRNMQIAFNHEKRDLINKVNEANNDKNARQLQEHIHQLNEIERDMRAAQEKVSEKVEKQIPQDLNELSAKCDNVKHQLSARIDREEEERFLSVREVQDALKKRDSKKTNVSASEPLKRDFERYKIAVKKLAESLTTVKNVLERKIKDEAQTREKDVQKLSAVLNSTINK